MGYDIEKEKREAIEVGQRALSSLRTAEENLNSAKNWGLVDMFGGGFFSTMLKHSKMDQARQNMEQAKYDLRNFSRELNDVNMACNLNINTGDFLSFADYFFDGFVVDWMVQDRINNARHQVEEAIRRTEYIINQLQHRRPLRMLGAGVLGARGARAREPRRKGQHPSCRITICARS